MCKRSLDSKQMKLNSFSLPPFPNFPLEPLCRLYVMVANVHRAHLPTILPRLVAGLTKRLKDAESAAREVAADALGSLARLACADKSSGDSLQVMRTFLHEGKPWK